MGHACELNVYVIYWKSPQKNCQLILQKIRNIWCLSNFSLVSLSLIAFSLIHGNYSFKEKYLVSYLSNIPEDKTEQKKTDSQTQISVIFWNFSCINGGFWSKTFQKNQFWWKELWYLFLIDETRWKQPANHKWSIYWLLQILPEN